MLVTSGTPYAKAAARSQIHGNPRMAAVDASSRTMAGETSERSRLWITFQRSTALSWQ